MNKKVFNGLNDCELVSLAVKGEIEAFHVLLTRYSGSIRDIASSFYFTQGVDKEDYYQEGVINFYYSIFSYDASKSDNFRNYAFMRVKQAMQRLYNSANAKKHIPLTDFIQIDELCALEAYNGSPDEIIVFNEKKNNFFSSLSPFEFQVAQLYLLGFSRQSIADRLSCTLKQIDNAIHRIREKFKKYFK